MKTVRTLQHGPVSGFQFGYSPIRLVKPLPVWCYYVDGLLIDTAQRHCQSEVLATLKSLPINQIALTHFHEDHTGNASALRRQHQAVVLASFLTAHRIDDGFELLPYERFWFGHVDPCPDVNLLPDVLRTERYTFQVISTPGHSDDHHVLLEPNEGWLFAGDFYIGNLKLFRRGENIHQMINSTRHLLTYDFDTIFCGHNPVLKNGKQAVERKLQYLETLVQCVREGYNKGLRGQALVKLAGLKEQWILRFFTANDVSAYYLIESVIKDVILRQMSF